MSYFSWITGARITNVVEDLQDEGNTTIIDAPETPAPAFAVKAFKHAIWGTPKPEETRKLPSVPKEEPVTARKHDEKKKQHAKDLRETERVGSKEMNGMIQEEAKPNGILMTPGTVSKGRKTVSFGAQVVDNEGKKQNGRSGIPADCPGKFPSPFTPKTIEPTASKPRNKFTEALYEARDSASKPVDKPPAESPKRKARDDNDIAMDDLEPRSESGKFWKEAHLAYATKSEMEMKKLVKKQKLAKQYAKKKDTEAVELATRLTDERKRHQSRERELEKQLKEYQEKLRKLQAENLQYTTEIALLKQRVESHETSKSKSQYLTAQAKPSSSPPKEQNHPIPKQTQSWQKEPESSMFDDDVPLPSPENSFFEQREQPDIQKPQSQSSNTFRQHHRAHSTPDPDNHPSTISVSKRSNSTRQSAASKPSRAPLQERGTNVSKNNVLASKPQAQQSSTHNRLRSSQSSDPWMEQGPDENETQDQLNLDNPYPHWDRMALPIASNPPPPPAEALPRRTSVRSHQPERADKKAQAPVSGSGSNIVKGGDGRVVSNDRLAAARARAAKRHASR